VVILADFDFVRDVDLGVGEEKGLWGVIVRRRAGICAVFVLAVLTHTVLYVSRRLW
jgi:hypothetical protein